MFAFSQTCKDVNVFAFWHKNVNEAKAKVLVSLLMDHYDFPLWDVPTETSAQSIQFFYHSKFAMFTCFDSEAYMGLIELDPKLIGYWDSSLESLRYTWYLSVAYALA